MISTLRQRWNDIVQRSKTVALMLCNVVSTLDPENVSMLWHVEIRFRILFHFQHRINVIWTVIYNVETTLIQRWNVLRVVSMKKLILRNNLYGTLLTKWNLLVFFKDYAKTFTKSVFTSFFWWLQLRIPLRLVVSNSSGLQKVPY